MNTEEIIVNEEVVSAVEDIVLTNSGNKFKFIGKVGLVLGVCGLAYHYGKPLVSKLKHNKNEEDEIVVGEVEICGEDK